MRPALLLTAFDRPEYLATVLDSWALVPELADWHVRFALEPGPATARVESLVRAFLARCGLTDAAVVVNDERLGVSRNPHRHLGALFDAGHDFVVRAEDDLVVADDVHLGGTLTEIAAGEQATARGQQAARPFVLLAQQSLFDATRAPAGQHTAWAYCHVPNGSRQNMTATIEAQVERFAPGFRARILARHTLDTAQMEEYNPNYVGGDINGGLLDISQLFTRPALRASPYRTSLRGLYLCSSATPPGGGVHGLCGYWAARRALRDVFGLAASPLYRG